MRELFDVDYIRRRAIGLQAPDGTDDSVDAMPKKRRAGLFKAKAARDGVVPTPAPGEGVPDGDHDGSSHTLRGHGFGARIEENQPVGSYVPTGKFGRMFPDLPEFIPDENKLIELGRAMKDLAAEENPLDKRGDNDNVPAGFTYLGQFIDHDITFDTTSLQEVLEDPLALRNFRTPSLDLDCVYGSGPVAQPYLYERANVPERLLIGKTSTQTGKRDHDVKPKLPFDLQRADNGYALIGDPRNDENLIVAQMHLTFVKFHNKVVDWLKDERNRKAPLRKTLFEEARDTVIWHYQWIVVHDFLERILDREQFKTVRDNGQHFYRLEKGQDPYIPLEFSGAAYRFGHSMVREVYDYNSAFDIQSRLGTLKLLFEFSGLSGKPPAVPIPSEWIIDWRRFFEVRKNEVVPGLSRKLDPFLAPSLHQLPGREDEGPSLNSLAVINLLRGRKLKLPPGQSVATFMGFDPLTPEQLGSGPDGKVAAQQGFLSETPLWYYILKEAELQGKGRRLGQVGSRIVGEVFFGLMRADPNSYLRRKPNWKPTLPVMPTTEDGKFTMADLLHFVGDINPIGDPKNRKK
ncbi:heme peroxidase family protein [Nocardia sp. NPDC052278]|uniref:peroxidase family protein n=1 Tax=unclassified Nocardia TaxID=2637762 RepID=UPI0036B2D44D